MREIQLLIARSISLVLRGVSTTELAEATASTGRGNGWRGVDHVTHALTRKLVLGYGRVASAPVGACRFLTCHPSLAHAQTFRSAGLPPVGRSRGPEPHTHTPPSMTRVSPTTSSSWTNRLAMRIHIHRAAAASVICRPESVCTIVGRTSRLPR